MNISNLVYNTTPDLTFQFAIARPLTVKEVKQFQADSGIVMSGTEQEPLSSAALRRNPGFYMERDDETIMIEGTLVSCVPEKLVAIASFISKLPTTAA